MLADGSSTDEVIERLLSRYEGKREELADATIELVRELRREELLHDDPDAVERVPAVNGAPLNGGPGTRAQFDRPTLHKYTDMQYFLLLDPIHEVSGVGWPNPSEQASG